MDRRRRMDIPARHGSFPLISRPPSPLSIWPNCPSYSPSPMSWPPSPVSWPPSPVISSNPPSPVVSWPPSPEISGPPSPLIGRPPSPVISRSLSPVISRSLSPLISRPSSPLISRPSSPLISRHSSNSSLPNTIPWSSDSSVMSTDDDSSNSSSPLNSPLDNTPFNSPWDSSTDTPSNDSSMPSEDEDSSNELIKKGMDQQRWLDILACHGSSLLNVVVGNTSNSTSQTSQLNTVRNFPYYDSDNETDEELMFKFIKSKFNEIGDPDSVPEPNCLLKPDPLVAMPPEMYRRTLDKKKRRQLFYKHLQRRDILYLQVINGNDPEGYKCLVLAKHEDLARLDDLSIVMYFPKLPPEMQLLRGDLYKFELIRGAFWSGGVWDRHMFVTMDTSIFNEQERENIPKLGRITRKDLPYFVDCQKIGMTYAGYVQRSPGYKEEGYCMKQLRDCLGVDTNRIYSFNEEWDGKTYPASESLAELRKHLHPDPSTKRLHKSFEYFRGGNMFKALHYANKAIAFNPDHIQARVTRGTVYANLGKMKKAFIDTEDSLKLDPKHESASRQMSELLVAASKTHLLHGKYNKWHESLVLARKYNPNNREAQELLTKSSFETYASTSTNPGPAPVLIPPSMADVAPIYNRVFPQVDKRRLLKQYRKQRKRKRRHRRRRSDRRNSQRGPLVGQPIPTTTTRRQVFSRSGSDGFRRPFPPRSINTRYN